jgi:PAS domain S-box-containing protein
MSRLTRSLRVPVAAAAAIVVVVVVVAFRFGPQPAGGDAGGLVPWVGRLVVVAGAALLITHLALWPPRSRVPEEAQLLRAVADGIDEVVFVKDLRGKYLFINRAGAELMRRSPGEVVGRGTEEFFPPHVARALRAACEPVLATGRPSRAEHDLPTPRGTRTFASTKVPYRNGRGELVGVMGVAHDVTDRMRIEAQLRRSHEQLADVLESITDGMYACDHGWRFTYINGRARRLLRLSDADLGRALWQVRPEVVGSAFDRQFHRVMAERTGAVFEAEYDARHWEVHAYPTAEGIAVYFQDITARERARAALVESEQRYRFVAKATSDVIWDWDVRTGRVYFNSALRTVLGHGEADVEATERWWWGRVHEEDRARVRDSLDATFAGTAETWSGEYRYRRGDGTYADIFDRAWVVRDGSGAVTRVIGAMQDQSERKRADELRRERNGLRDAVRAMDRVLGVVGHELRTPLAGLRAMSEFLLDEGARQTEGWDRFLRDINDEVIRMSQTVNDLLEAARLNSGRATWNFGAVALGRVCEDALTIVRPLVDQSRVALRSAVCPPDLCMTGDADALRRLVLNLVSNSRKHTTAGSIDVRVTTRREAAAAGRWVEIRVSDTGAGIPPEIADRLGEPFALNSGAVGANHVGGTGLGLAICKAIAAAHGGAIRFESAAGAGTTVTVALRADLGGPVREANAPPRSLPCGA